MQTTREPIYEHTEMPILRRTSWPAILAGVAVAVVIQIMFTLLAISFGMATVDPQTEAQPLSGLGTITGIWTAVGAIVALFAGGWTAARLAGNPNRQDGILQGVVTGAVVTIIGMWMMTSAVGRVLNAASGALGSALSAAGQGIQAAGQGVAAAIPDDINAPNISAEELRSRAQTYLREVGISEQTVDQYISNSTERLQNAATQAATNPDQAYNEITTALQGIAQRGSNIAQNNVNQEDAVNLLVENTGMSRDQAQTAVQEWSAKIQTEYAQATNPAEPTFGERVENTAERVGDTVAGSISSFAAWTFVSIVVGLIAAAGGGALGAPHRLEMASSEDRELADGRLQPRRA